MFFLSLLVMLFFSTGIITLHGLFQSREAAFLLTTPASADRIFAYKFVEAIGFSSWGFLLLGSPLMVAYGITVEAPRWRSTRCSWSTCSSFVLIPGSLGAIAAIAGGQRLPEAAEDGPGGSAVGALVVAGGRPGVRLWRTPGDDAHRATGSAALLGPPGVQPAPALAEPVDVGRAARLGPGRLADGPVLPDGPRRPTPALAYLAAAVVARDLYRRGYSRVQGGRSSRRRIGLVRARRALPPRSSSSCPRPIRLLILKDLRTFRRDPAQWSQFLIFFGLLAFYFLNIRRLGYDVQSPYWRNLVSFLNLAVTALILSTFTSRFIFPLLSLEGRNFWVLGPACRCSASRSSGASSRSRRGSRWWRPRSWSSSAT